ncbi:MAG: hypothetical protein CMN58_05460 [Solibacterales bacterium]|nr:hypothetical protein [Bryobacterales bacterium]|tara:strand:- start:3120 stop:3710 length:591 start_codon:yes stop_codon:yes gene_type:complete
MTNNSDSASLQNVPLSRRISVAHVTLALTALLLFDGVFYWFAVHPLDARKQEVITAIKVLEKQVRQRVETVEHVNSAIKRIESARLIGSNLMKNITVSRQVAFSTLVTELDAAANRAEIENRDRTYNIEPVEGTSGYGIVRVNANFRGRYENVVRFLNLIDRSETFLIIESLGASPRSDSDDLQITMRIDTFVRDL